MTTNRDTARSAVEAILGKSGQAVVNYVDEAVSSAQSEFDARFTELVERLSATDGLAAEQTRLSRAITALASRTDSKASAEQVADIQNDIRSLRTIVAGAGRMLAGAMEATNVAATASTPEVGTNAIDQARSLADEAEAAQRNCARQLSDLENRVAALESRMDRVEENLNDHDRRIAALEEREDLSPELEPETDPSGPPWSETQTTTTTFQHRVNPVNWGWLAWTLAIVGGFIALMIAMAWLSPAILGWLASYPDIVKNGLAFLAGAALTGVGFFGGGLLGANIAEEQTDETEQSTTTVTTAS